jgi:DNA modification methylase
VDLGWLATCDHDDDTGRSVVLDPFAGAGTVGVVCGWHARDFIGCELNPTYAEMARESGSRSRAVPVAVRRITSRVVAEQLGLL